MNKAFQLINISLFSVILIFIGTAALLGNSNYLVQDKSWINGEQASNYETHFNDELPIKQLGINLWAAIEYLIFNEGRKGVEIGLQGWLFSTEELKAYQPEDDYTLSNFNKIKSISERLSQQNIELVVALVPSKARIYESRLNHQQPSSDALQRYQLFSDWLQAENIHWTGFKGTFLAAKSQQAVFFRTDTHWTPNGAKLAAKQLGHYIERLDKSLLGNSQLFTTTSLESETHEGDLMSFIPIRDYFPWLGPQPDSFKPQVTSKSDNKVTNDTEGLLFDAPQTFNITLVGTSYSANERWNFVGALQQQLGQGILNYAEEGHGPIKPMEKYLASDDYKDSPPKLIIWEFPERYLPIK